MPWCVGLVRNRLYCSCGVACLVVLVLDSSSLKARSRTGIKSNAVQNVECIVYV